MAYLTNTEFKTYRGITGSGDDTLITTLITAAQAAIDAYCGGRTFEASGDTTRYFVVGEDTDGQYLYFDEDLAAITSITNGDGNAVAGTEYVTMPRNRTPYYALRLLDKSSVSWTYGDDPHEDAVAIVGKWAYSTTAPADIVQACRMLTAYYYDNKDQSGGDLVIVPGTSVSIPQGMPAEVRRLLAPYVRVV